MRIELKQPYLSIKKMNGFDLPDSDPQSVGKWRLKGTIYEQDFQRPEGNGRIGN